MEARLFRCLAISLQMLAKFHLQAPTDNGPRVRLRSNDSSSSHPAWRSRRVAAGPRSNSASSARCRAAALQPVFGHRYRCHTQTSKNYLDWSSPLEKSANVIPIASQKPPRWHTLVAGFNIWHKLGRFGKIARKGAAQVGSAVRDESSLTIAVRRRSLGLPGRLESPITLGLYGRRAIAASSD